MNVLVTGIDGFVGSHLAEALLADSGKRVVGTVLDSTLRNIPPPLRGKIEFLRADVTQPEQIHKAILHARPSQIIHLAGQAFVPLSVQDPAGTFRANFDGTLNILEGTRRYLAESKAACSVLVVSSGEVYGPVPEKRQPIRESEPMNPGNPYAASKACADILAQQYRRAFGLDVVVARPFNHLGPRQSELFVGSAMAKQIAAVKTGRARPVLKVGNLDPERDFTDVRDVVLAYLRIIERPRDQAVYNLCSGISVSVRKIVDLLCRIAGVELAIEIDESRRRKSEIARLVGDCALLKKETGWAPSISLERTLEDLLAYWEDRVRTEG